MFYRAFIIFFFGSLAVICGCDSQLQQGQASEPIWQKVKMRDLRPSEQSQPEGYALKTINLNLYTFEVEAGNIDSLDAIWQELSDKSLNYHSEASMEHNSLRVGFGEGQMWRSIAARLQSAEARQAEMTSVLLRDGGSNFAMAATFKEPSAVYYLDEAGSLEKAELGRGGLYFYIRAQKIAGARGVARVQVMPIFSASAQPRDRTTPIQLAMSRKFSDLAFEVEQMSPGQFVVIGPEGKAMGDLTITGALFSDEQGYHRLKVYVLACISIKD